MLQLPENGSALEAGKQNKASPARKKKQNPPHLRGISLLSFSPLQPLSLPILAGPLETCHQIRLPGWGCSGKRLPGGSLHGEPGLGMALLSPPNPLRAYFAKKILSRVFWVHVAPPLGQVELLGSVGKCSGPGGNWSLQRMRFGGRKKRRRCLSAS